MTTPWNSQVMADDPQLLKRGLDYLQAVGDVMTDERLDCLLLDPVGWSAPSFYPQP
jgi:hypothetical protein